MEYQTKARAINATAYLYVSILLLMQNIRWIAPLYNNRAIFALPLALVMISPLVTLPFIGSDQNRLIKIHIGILGFFAVFAMAAFDFEALNESTYVFSATFLSSTAALGALVLTKLNGKTSIVGKALPIFAITSLVQVLWMYFESRMNLSTFFRPNGEGTAAEWFFSSRYDAERARYTFSSPMVAGSWLWFMGTWLIILGSSGKFGSKQKVFFITSGLTSWFGVFLSVSRGPIFSVLISAMAMLTLYLVDRNKRKIAITTIFMLITVIGISMETMSTEFANPIFRLLNEAFETTEAGNIERITAWTEGLKTISNSQWIGNGLSSIAYLKAEEEINFESTFLNLIYATGILGVAFSLYIVITWIVFLLIAWFDYFGAGEKNAARLFAIVGGTAWFPYMFIFPCFREVETAVITYSLFFLLINTQSNLKNWHR
jgi:hypothetical protein